MIETERVASGYRPDSVTTGIVHIGLGAFHRAHQAWYLHRLMQMGEAHDWAILGGFTIVHQFCRIGCHCFTGMGSEHLHDGVVELAEAGEASRERHVGERHGGRLDEGAGSLGSLIVSLLDATNVTSALGFGWLSAYAIMSGSPIAAAARRIAAFQLKWPGPW